MLNTLREKQEYYVYGERPYRMRNAPALDPDLVEALRREHLDKSYRFVWGGVALVREEPNSPEFAIARGDRNACYELAIEDGKTQLPKITLMPKYLFVRARQARGVYYVDDLNRKVALTRPELVPAGRIALVDYRYVDLGVLRWFLEGRVSGQYALDKHIYNKDEKIAESEWTCIKKMQTKKGLYYEPGLEMIPILQQREWENQNADLAALARESIERREKREQELEEAQDAQDRKDVDQMYQDALRSTQKQTAYSIPILNPKVSEAMSRLFK